MYSSTQPSGAVGGAGFQDDYGNEGFESYGATMQQGMYSAGSSGGEGQHQQQLMAEVQQRMRILRTVGSISR